MLTALRLILWLVVYLVCLGAFTIETEYTDGRYIFLKGWFD